MEQHLSLLCCETDLAGKPHRAALDPVLIGDTRVLANLLASEDKYLPHTCYFNCVQTDIQPFMRKMVTEWMAEVCTEQKMEEEVFPLSVNYLDRFLSIKDIKRTRLQLLGAGCMFLASKLKETTPISGEQLVMYTDNSITLEDLTDMESCILHLLKWDLSAVVPSDFMDHILHRMPFNRFDVQIIKRRAQTIAAVCATDYKFMQTPASMIASAAIACSLKHLKSSSDNDLNTLHHITGIDKDLIRSCVEQVDQTISACLASAVPPSPHKQEQKQEQPTTPTDVRDINIVVVVDSCHDYSAPICLY